MKNRESNFELLRIASMLMIVWHHLCQHGIYLSPDAQVNFNTIIGKGFFVWTGNLGNWLFILTSGYFVSQSKFSWKKVFKLWLQIFTTSAIIGLIFFLLKTTLVYGDVDMLGFYNDSKNTGLFEAEFTPQNLWHSFLPTFFGSHWFASAYLLFYMFTPFLYESLKALDRKMHFKLILTMALFGTVFYMIPGQGFFESNSLFNFILGYYIATYLRLYNPKIFQNKKINFSLSIILSALFVIWIIMVLKFRNSISFIDSHFIQVYCYPFAINRFPVILNATLIFSIFRNMKITHNRFINLIASTTFGIYLIHENSYLNKILWHRIFKMDAYLNSKFLLPYMLLAVILTFTACSLIDFLRQNIIEKPVLKIFSGKKFSSETLRKND